MHPVTMIAKSIQNSSEKPELPCAPVDAICAITGEKTSCLPRKSVLGNHFTNGDILAAPESNWVGVDAFWALKYKWERASSWFCDGDTFERLDRKQVRDKVFKIDMPKMWIAYATTSYKKHGVMNTKINYGNKRVWLFETRLVNCTDTAKVNEIWGGLNDALRAGFGRSILETLECPPFLIKKIGIEKWLNFEKWAKRFYLSSLYSFMCYLLPSQEELKSEKATVNE